VYAVDGDGTAPGWGAGGVCVVDVAVSGEVVGVAVAVWVGWAAVAPGWAGAGAEFGSAVV
jgi:hypothetical protein